ncbi:hypothetical protein [Nitrospirillum sp. BR 11828]|uniref:hypothetical protein n=1 Tax=Nitrospirillum sp. BR 11828 TaxID=3104325 RepID=UPI002ACAC719|nr:hypothetical protein [Nitrospirillum sp. BR 11828]MDZ5650201.1 hypothetical protein [Nitrospirillum sp. BR 11828]
MRILFTGLALRPGGWDRGAAATPSGERLEELYWLDHGQRPLTGHDLAIGCGHRHDLDQPTVGK